MRSNSIYLVVPALTVLACGGPTRAQSVPATPAPQPPAVKRIDPAKEKIIRRLLEVTGTAKLMQQSVDQMIAAMQSSIPDVPADYWDKTRTKFKSDDLIALIIPIYDKNYSQEELEGLLAFDESPLGQKLIATLPEVNRESLEAGQEWGRRKAHEVLAEIEQDRKSAQRRAKTKTSTM